MSVINLQQQSLFNYTLQVNGIDIYGANQTLVIRKASDLPPAVGGKHTLLARRYFIDTSVLNIGTNYLECVDGTVITGSSSLNTTLIYSGTGAAIRGVDVSCSFSFFSISSPQSFNFTNTGRTKFLSIQNFGIASQTSASVITGYKTVLCNIINCLGNVGVFTFTDNGFVVCNLINIDSTNTGTFITLNPQTYTKFSLFSCDIVVQTGNVGVNITSTNILYGQIKKCSFSGTAAFTSRLTGVNGGTVSWNIAHGSNDGISGLQIVDVDVVSTADATLGNGSGTYIEPTTVRGFVMPLINYDAMATTMHGQVVALMTNAAGSAVQIGLRNLTDAVNIAGLSVATEGTLVSLSNSFVNITPNKIYNAYYVKLTGASTRHALKIRLKIF